MSFLTDVQELKTGLIIFRRADVKHRSWYCRVKIPDDNRYKTVSLKTPDLREARDKAFDHDADIRFRVKHDVPIFDKTFAEVAKDYLDDLKGVVAIGQITQRRWDTVESYIRLHLIAYVGNDQITLIGEDKWKSYPLWRKQNGKGHTGEAVKDATIRGEMMVFRAVMRFAAEKRHIPERQVPKGKVLTAKDRREEFTPQEYRQLHTFTRSWIKEAKHERSRWHRTVAYNFILIMANTGMRTMEARNLRWRDIDARNDKHGRPFVCVSVRGKGKFRELIAPQSVASYFERIRAISTATKPDDFVFTTREGKPAITLYSTPIEDILTKSKLLISASGSRRSSYCFRHTYATFRLMEGIDVYFLAKQMGTSVKMIEDHYGHITPAKNAERILQGIPGWEPIAESVGGALDGVNAGPAKANPAKLRTKKKK